MIPNLVFAHDSLTVPGGAERTLDAMLGLSDGPLYTAVFRPRMPLASLAGRRVHGSWLQYLPVPIQLLKPLFPRAFEGFRLPAGTEVVLSSSSGYAKGIHAPAGAVHVSYVHTPLRRVWNPYHRAARCTWGGRLGARLERLVLQRLRCWDLMSMQGVDCLLTNAKNTARQIQQIYGREAIIVHPPVNTSFFVPPPAPVAGGYFLVVSRLDPYKRVDLAIRACHALDASLVIVGDGVERSRLERLAGPRVEFAGLASDAALRALYQGCRALIFPGEEDFGIVPVEAQACGKPVVAFAKGGALETVVEELTGVLFHDQTVDALVQALQRCAQLRFDPGVIRAHALQFDARHFQSALAALVRRVAGVRSCA